MTTTNKATKAKITYNGIELDGYMLPDGSYHLSKTQVALAIEKDDKSVPSFLSGKSPEALPYKHIKMELVEVENSNIKIHSVPLDLVYSYWFYHANKGWEPAQKLLIKLGKFTYEEGFKIFGINFKNNLHFNKKIKQNTTKLEKKLQLTLNNALSGLCEVTTPVGKIDILTDKLLIEIKIAKDWKTAVGQLLMYGNYYPNHKKIMYLFNPVKDFNISIIAELCQPHGIALCLTLSEIVSLQFDSVRQIKCCRTSETFTM